MKSSVLNAETWKTQSNCRGPGGASAQAVALRREGVVVSTGHLGELTVDLGTFGWFPDNLLSEEGGSDIGDE